MGAAGVWYVMVTALLSTASEKHCPPLLFKSVVNMLCLIFAKEFM